MTSNPKVPVPSFETLQEAARVYAPEVGELPTEMALRLMMEKTGAPGTEKKVGKDLYDAVHQRVGSAIYAEVSTRCSEQGWDASPSAILKMIVLRNPSWFNPEQFLKLDEKLQDKSKTLKTRQTQNVHRLLLGQQVKKVLRYIEKGMLPEVELQLEEAANPEELLAAVNKKRTKQGKPHIDKQGRSVR